MFACKASVLLRRWVLSYRRIWFQYKRVSFLLREYKWNGNCWTLDSRKKNHRQVNSDLLNRMWVSDLFIEAILRNYLWLNISIQFLNKSKEDSTFSKLECWTFHESSTSIRSRNTSLSLNFKNFGKLQSRNIFKYQSARLGKTIGWENWNSFPTVSRRRNVLSCAACLRTTKGDKGYRVIRIDTRTEFLVSWRRLF